MESFISVFPVFGILYASTIKIVSRIFVRRLTDFAVIFLLRGNFVPNALGAPKGPRLCL